METFESRRRSSTWSAGLRARAPKKLSCKPCRTIATTFVAPHLAACSNQSSARSLQGVSHAVPSSKLLSPATRAGGGGGGAGSAFGGGGHGAVGGCGTAARPTPTAPTMANAWCLLGRVGAEADGKAPAALSSTCSRRREMQVTNTKWMARTRAHGVAHRTRATMVCTTCSFLR